MDSPIKDVSDTAFWIAHLRAVESDRANALFRDPLAGKLAGERGRKIAEGMPTSRIVGWTVALRTKIIDEFIGFALNEGVDTVLSLGAGLDARPYRMSLPVSLRWIEADYPRMIDYKEQQLQGIEPRCRIERVRIDLADRAERQKLFERVNAQSNGILVLTEGVVPYLTNDDVDLLARDVSAMNQARFWVMDFFTAEALEYRRRHMGNSMQNAPFKFAPDDWVAFFEQRGWRARDVRYFNEEARRLGRPAPLPLRIKFMMAVSGYWISRERREAMDRLAGYALLEPVGPG